MSGFTHRGLPNTSSIRVLIVDDFEQVREDLHTLLSVVGDIEIVGEAGDGQQALGLVEATRPDVVLMDLEMPTMDGYHATRRIKTSLPSCRVIALSVHSDETSRQKAAEAGVDVFVEKGAPFHELIEAITEKSK